MKNYIGVTGVANISDVFVTTSNFRNAGINMQGDHIPMIGFLVTPKTIYEIPPKSGKIPHQRYPPISSLRKMMEYSKGDALNMIHFSTKEADCFSKEIKYLFELDNIYNDNLCRALQLNIKFPKESELETILNKFPDMSIVLQLPREILSEEKNILAVLENYSSLVQGMLIDPSGGRGREFDVDSATRIYQQIKEKCPGLIVGFAGGLNGTNVGEKIISFRKQIGSEDFSLDAEGGIRIVEKDKQGKMIIDMLEPNLQMGYLASAKKSFN